MMIFKKGDSVSVRNIEMMPDRKHPNETGVVVSVMNTDFRPYCVRFKEGEFWYDENELIPAGTKGDGNAFKDVARMRTAHQAAEYFKQQDQETSFTEYHINRLINTGVIKVFHSGRRKLINLDKLIEYLNGEAKEPAKDSTYGKIRRVGE